MIGVRLGVGHHFSGGFDSSAQAFFTATGITGATEQQAVNTLVTSLKSAGLWSKMKAVYPFVTDNRNLLSYTEDFGNAYWQKGNTTITANTTAAPNGTNTADKVSETSGTGYHFLSFTDGAMINTNNYTVSFYAKASERTWCSVYLYDGSTLYQTFFDLANGAIGTIGSGMTASIESAGNGWYRCRVSRNIVGAMGANGGILTATGNNQSNYAGTAGNGIFVWGAQLELGSTATTYQPIATTQQSYISNQFKYNLVNPVDSDAAFRLVFNGGWTMSNQGATPNGTNGYADTKFITSSNLTINDQSYSVYSRTNTAAGNKRELGVNYFGEISVIAKFTGDLFYPVIGGGTYPNVSNTDSRGHYIANRTDSTNIKGYKNGSLILNALQTSALPTTYGIYIGCRNDNGVANQYTDRQLAFSHLGQGLTDSEATALYNAVQTFNTSLSRQV